MGMYLNPKIESYLDSLNSKIYVDKSLLIAELNEVVCTEEKHVCISRPRRFGKSMALKMLAAYYQCDVDTHDIFCNQKIASRTTFERHINKYDVVWIDMQEVLSKTQEVGELTSYLTCTILNELREAYGVSEDKYLFDGFKKVNITTGRRFVFLIDEWDCVMREMKDNREQQDLYLDFLRGLFKGQSYVALTYMTGILPIRNYGTFSTLNIFTEYTVIAPGKLAEYFGFTVEETRGLCEKYEMDFEEIQKWYDGYELWSAKTGTVHVYNPNSVVKAMLSGELRSYWRRTERMEALKGYINMDFKALKGDVAELLAGEKVEVEVGAFKDDMETFATKDDILTLLIHLGYLTYNTSGKLAYVPNHEIEEEFYLCVRESEGYGMVYAAIEASRDLLKSLWKGDSAAVCAGIRKAHQEMLIIRRNDENSLSCVVILALYSARDYYSVVREMPTGEGFADIAFIPTGDKPAMIVELKWDKSAETALDQIRSRNYAGALAAYADNLLLVGVNYDKESHEYECSIEKL